MYVRAKGPKRSVHHYTDYVKAVQEEAKRTIQQSKQEIKPKKTYTPRKKKNRKEARQKRKERKESQKLKRLTKNKPSKEKEIDRKVKSYEPEPEPEPTPFYYYEEPTTEEIEYADEDEILEMDDANDYLSALATTIWEVKESLQQKWKWDIGNELGKAAYQIEDALSWPYERKVELVDLLSANPYLENLWTLLNFEYYQEVTGGTESIADTIISIVESVM